MSRIIDLGEKYQKLPAILEEYEAELEQAETILAVKGKRLEAANVENAPWQHFYDQKKIELYTLVKYFDMEIARVRGKLFRSYKENHSRELSEREINRYLDNEDSYLTVYGLYLEVKEMYEKYDAVVSAFTSRGYSLNNITKIRVASLEDVEL